MHYGTDGSGMIYFLGDVHGHFGHVLEIVQRDRPAAIVFLGDVQAGRPLEVELESILDLTEVWFIHGNHDTDSDADYDHLFNSTLAERNLHGRIAEVAGVRIAGLGGVFRGQVWAPPASWNYESQHEFSARCGQGNHWRSGLPRKHYSTIFPEDYFQLVAERADILVTHEAPSAHPHGFEAIDELARSLRVTKAFHGHHHDCLDYSHDWARLGFAAFGVGYCGVTDMDGNCILAGEFDEARAMRGRVAQQGSGGV